MLRLAVPKGRRPIFGKISLTPRPSEGVEWSASTHCPLCDFSSQAVVFEGSSEQAVVLASFRLRGHLLKTHQRPDLAAGWFRSNELVDTEALIERLERVSHESRSAKGATSRTRAEAKVLLQRAIISREALLCVAEDIQYEG